MAKEIKQIMEQEFSKAAAAENKEVQTFINELKEGAKMENAGTTSKLIDLVNLIVITHQEKTLLKSDMYDFISQFIDEPNDSTGNGHRYIKHYIQQPLDWTDVKDKFIPDGFSKTAFTVQFIAFKKADGSLEEGSIQKAFNATYSVVDMITYFINGQLDVFIEEQIIGKLGDSVVVFLYDFVMKKLTDETGGKVVNGTAANLFDALTQEVLPEVKQMMLNSNKYNRDQTLKYAIDASKKEDLLLLCSPKVKTILETNIMSQLFNSAKIELTQFFGQIHVANNKFIYTDGVAQTEEVQYVDDNTLFIIDRKNYLKVLKMLKFSGEQDYPLNMSKMRIIHLWLASGYLKWGKAFIYKNNNLSVSPSNELTE